VRDNVKHVVADHHEGSEQQLERVHDHFRNLRRHHRAKVIVSSTLAAPSSRPTGTIDQPMTSRPNGGGPLNPRCSDSDPSARRHRPARTGANSFMIAAMVKLSAIV